MIKIGNRFIDELLPRDVVTKAIQEQMKKDGTDHVWLSLEKIPKEIILSHFPNIYLHCLEEGYDATKEWDSSRAGSALHLLGGIWVDSDSHTSMAKFICSRRDKLQRCSWKEPTCKQFSFGESCIC